MADSPFLPGDTYEPVEPRIGDIQPITMRCEYQLPWNRQSNQSACGRTIQTAVGDKNWRIVIEGVINMPQLNQLRQMRGEPNVEVVTEEFGKMTVKFDQLNITRTSEEDVGEIDEVIGPLLEFQLQTKEEGEEGEGIEFYNENTRGASED